MKELADGSLDGSLTFHFKIRTGGFMKKSAKNRRFSGPLFDFSFLRTGK
jgi:hypothetical protein